MSACAPSGTRPASSPPSAEDAAQRDDGGFFPIDQLGPMAALASLPVAADGAPLTQPAWPPPLVPVALAVIATSAVLYAGLGLAMDRGHATEQRLLAPGWRSATAEPRPSLVLSDASRRRTHRSVPRRPHTAPKPRARPIARSRPRRRAPTAVARSTHVPTNSDIARPAPASASRSASAPAPRPSPPACEFEPSCAGPGERP